MLHTPRHGGLASGPNTYEEHVLLVELATEGGDYVIVSPGTATRVIYRIPTQSVEVLDSLTSADGKKRWHVAIRTNATLLKSEFVSAGVAISELVASGAIDDVPVAISSSRVDKAKALLASPTVYAKGCSEFVCAVLGVAWEDANSLMGASPTLIGDNNNYPGLVPGDIVGWKVGGGNGHVAVYVGDPGMKFIDVREPGAKPRKVVNGYGSGQPLYKSAKY